MTYSSLTPVISDRTAYPNLFSTIPSALSYQIVINGTMNYYGWNRLVVVSQLENEFDLVSVVIKYSCVNCGFDIRVKPVIVDTL